MTDQTEFRTLNDGSIDHAFYLQRGRTLRSRALYDALDKLRMALRPRHALRSRRTPAVAGDVAPAPREEPEALAAE